METGEGYLSNAKKAPNKANALGQQKAPLVPRSVFCCR